MHYSNDFSKSFNPKNKWRKVSAAAWAEGILLINQAFPKLPNGWYEILMETIDQEQFSDEIFLAAIHNLIKTCQHPVPTIANVVQFGKGPIGNDFLKFYCLN